MPSWLAKAMQDTQNGQPSFLFGGPDEPRRTRLTVIQARDEHPASYELVRCAHRNVAAHWHRFTGSERLLVRTLQAAFDDQAAVLRGEATETFETRYMRQLGQEARDAS